MRHSESLCFIPFAGWKWIKIATPQKAQCVWCYAESKSPIDRAMTISLTVWRDCTSKSSILWWVHNLERDNYSPRHTPNRMTRYVLTGCWQCASCISMQSSKVTTSSSSGIWSTKNLKYREFEVPRTTIRKVLHKSLHLDACKLQITEALEENDQPLSSISFVPCCKQFILTMSTFKTLLFSD